MSGPAVAACLREVEPNDAPELVGALHSGAFCVQGMARAGDQDLVGWTVDQAGLWRLRLETVPGLEGVVELIRMEAEGPRPVWRGELDSAEGLAQSPPLLLEGGRWFLAIATPAESMRWRARAEPVETPAEGAGLEATDAFHARLTGDGEAVAFQWRLTPEAAAGLWDLKAQAPTGLTASAEVYAPDGSYLLEIPVSWSDGVGIAADLRLEPGDYRIELRGLAPGATAFLSAFSPGLGGPEVAAEPDHDLERAHPIAPGESRRARLVAATDAVDADVYAFEVPPDAEGQFAIAADSGSARPLKAALVDSKGGLLAEAEGVGSVRMGPFAPPPGRYGVRISGNLDPAESYVLTLDRAPPLAPGREAEPNDREDYATPLAAGEMMSGVLSPGENDHLALEIPEGALGWWTIEAGSEGQIQLDLLDAAGGGTIAGAQSLGEGGTRLSSLPLAPGRNLLRLRGEGPWTLTASPAPPPEPDEEREPNDDPFRATPLTEAPLSFRLDHGGDLDHFALTLAAPTQVTLTITAPAEAAPSGSLGLPVTEFESGLEFAPDPEDPERWIARWSGILPAGSVIVRLQGAGASSAPGSIAAILAPPFDPPPEGSLGKARPERALLAAHEPQTQNLILGADFTDPPPDARLIGWVSDEDWRLVGPLAASGADSPEFRLEAPPDLEEGEGVRWALALVDPATGATLAMAQGEVEAQAGARPLDPAPLQPLPSPLLGALDAARPIFGAVVPEAQAQLFDGLSDGAAVELPVGEALEIDLAGEAPLPVLGLTLTPPAVGPPARRLRHFRIEAAEDGDFSSIYEGELSPTPRAQPVVFSSSVLARRLRLTALESWGGEVSATLSEFSVLTPPESLPEARDLALPELGGHVASASAADATLVGEAAQWPGGMVRFLTPEGERAEWVLQFYESRAAPIARIAATADLSAPPEERFEVLSVEASLRGPAGPWTRIGDLAFDAGTGEASLDPPAPLWARALRFSGTAPDAGERVAPPASISVVEDRAAAKGGTILGAWGERSSVAFYESLHPPPPQEEGLSGGASAEDPQALPPETLGAGLVAPDRPTWYRLDPPPEALRLVLAETGDGVGFSLTDRLGAALPLSREPAGLVAGLTPGNGPYLLRVAKPPDAIVVAWDTSLSVGVFAPMIMAAVREMATGLAPGVESMNFAPFRSGEVDGLQPLLQNFAATPAEAWGALQVYPGADADSDAEAALLVALRALSSEPGRRVVVLMTDASFTSDRSHAVWSMIGSAGPRIFALRIPTPGDDRGSRAQAAQMQDWAGATGGFHRLFAAPEDASRSFRDIAEILRRPTPYRFVWRAETSAPEPGGIAVIRPAGSAAKPGSGRAVEVILDASGSMLQRRDGERKIDLAKSVLSGLIETALPQGAPFALRVFGVGGPGSCDSEALLGLAPLDPAETLAAIAGVRAVDGAKTAIAASLRAVQEDMAAAEGEKLVVLITDGEETCGGDPLGEIEALRAAGLDVRVNIVGFDLNDRELKELFSDWAAAGGGDFLDAQDAASLRKAIAAALAPGYRILDAQGLEVMAGNVDGPAKTLPTGLYSVVIAEHPLRIFNHVEIRPGELTTLSLGSE